MTHEIQPPLFQKHEILLQARRIERETEERRLAKLKERLLALKLETRKPLPRAS
jgi:hypothetical protein